MENVNFFGGKDSNGIDIAIIIIQMFKTRGFMAIILTKLSELR